MPSKYSMTSIEDINRLSGMISDPMVIDMGDVFRIKIGKVWDFIWEIIQRGMEERNLLMRSLESGNS